MNERIRELVKEAGFTVARGWGLKDTVPEDVFIANVCVSNEMKKFADLIVRECVDICMKNQFDGADHYNNGSISSAEFIKQHFGVEE
jgi:hypothetical protein